MTDNVPVTRYHGLLVALHWLIAILLIITLYGMISTVEHMPNTAEKIPPLRAHMIVGITLFTLMTVRLIVRFMTRKPAPMPAPHPVFERARSIVHALLYITVFAMASTGVGMAIMADLFNIVLVGNGQPLPESFSVFPPRAGHGLFSKVLVVLILAHLLAALYHQFVLKDGLLRRMWFGRRTS